MYVMKNSKVEAAKTRQEVSVPHIVQRQFMVQLIRSLSSRCGCVSHDLGPWALFSKLCNRMIMSSESFVSINYTISVSS